MAGFAHLCKFKDQCGSCRLSDLDYSQQLEFKKQRFIEKFPELKDKFIIEPSPKLTHYRNRMDYAIGYGGNSGCAVGLRAYRKWYRIIDGHTCFLAMESIEQAFEIVREWVHQIGYRPDSGNFGQAERVRSRDMQGKGGSFSVKKDSATGSKEAPGQFNSAVHLPKLPCFDRKKYRGFLRYAVIRANRAGNVLVTILTSPVSSEFGTFSESVVLSAFDLLDNKLKALFGQKYSLVWAVNSSKSDVSFGTVKKVVASDGFITEDFSVAENRVTYKITPLDFFQTNPFAAEVLLNRVVGGIDSERVLDLYAGSGFFSIALAKLRKHVTAVEISQELIRAGIENAKLNGVEINFVHSPVEKVEMLPDLWKDSTVIVDPPRAGLHPRVVRLLKAVGPGNIVYVSCKYQRFWEEFYKLGLSRSYTIDKVWSIDQFPQTPHLEVVFWLKRRVGKAG